MASRAVSTDITFAWGQQPSMADRQYAHYRNAVLQDAQQSLDGEYLYFLYDPVNDETSGTTGGRKADPSLVLFDLARHNFCGEVPLGIQTMPKYIFALPTPGAVGGTQLVLISGSKTRNGGQIHVSLMDLAANSLFVHNHRMLLTAPIDVGRDFFLYLREDAPEMFLMTGPGFHILRFPVDQRQQVTPSYTMVPGAHIEQFYDGFVVGEVIYLVSATSSGMVDCTRIHVCSLVDGRASISTHACTRDPIDGKLPPARKQAALNVMSGYLVLAGGEIAHPNGGTTRMVDYWALDLTTFQWFHNGGTMPIPLIEPRLTTTYDGHAYLWGESDQPMAGMRPGFTHNRLLKVTGLVPDNMGPVDPVASHPSGVPLPPAYPSAPPPPYASPVPKYGEPGKPAPAAPSGPPPPVPKYGGPSNPDPAAPARPSAPPAYPNTPPPAYQSAVATPADPGTEVDPDQANPPYPVNPEPLPMSPPGGTGEQKYGWNTGRISGSTNTQGPPPASRAGNPERTKGHPKPKEGEKKKKGCCTLL